MVQEGEPSKPTAPVSVMRDLPPRCCCCCCCCC